MSLSSPVDFIREVYVRKPSFSEVCKIFSIIRYKNYIIYLVSLVILENTTNLVNENEKKKNETIKTTKLFVQIHF